MRYLFIIFVILFQCSAVNAQQKLVIAGGSLTEIVYALDAGNDVVGVDMSSTYPEQVKNLPQIGYWRQLNTEGVMSLQPDAFLTWSDSGPEIVIKQLEENGINVVKFQRTPSTPQQLFLNIQQTATLLNKQAEGEALIASISKKIANVQQQLAQKAKKVRVLFILSIANEAAQIAGKHTVADGIISIAGGENVATHMQYQKYGGESIISLNPDVIIVTKESLGENQSWGNVATIAGVTHTLAWKNQHIIAIDQALILGMGPRIGDAIETLYEGFYPSN